VRLAARPSRRVAPGLLERVTRFFRPSILVFVHRGNRSVYRGTTSHSQPLWARLLLHVRVLSHEESLESILAGAGWQQPEFMFGLPSRIEWLARAQLEGRLAIDPVAVYVGGETLHAELLDLFRKAWPRSVVINTYGATETKAIATACGECGELHVLEDIVHLELYGEGGRPLQEGEFAHEVYCTGMWNRVTPVVRYAMTDRIQLLGDIGCAWRTRRIRVAGREPAFVWAQHQHTGAWVPLNARMLKESLVGLPDVLGFRVRYAEVGRLELTLVVSREGGEEALREAASRAVAELTRDQGSAVTELLAPRGDPRRERRALQSGGWQAERDQRHGPPARPSILCPREPPRAMSHDQRRDSELPPAKSAVQTSANDVMSRDSVDHFDPTVSGSLPLNYSSEFWAPDFRTSAWKAGALDRQDVLSKRLHPTLVHALVAAAKLEGDFGVTVLPERERDAPEVMTYRELYEDARSIANGLRELGTGRGDRILIVLPTCMDFLAVFFACQMVGAIPVPAYPPSGFRIETGLKRLAHIAQHSGSRLCVTWGTVGPLISEIAHTAKSLERVVNVPDLRGGRLPELHATRRDEPAFIQYTSGSTGNPKGVLLSHRNLITNIHGMGQALHIDHNDVLVGWCPLYHDMGLIGTFLSAVYWRLPLVLLSPSAFLTKPRRWLRAMSDYGGTISPAPNFGYALAVKRVKEEDRAGLDLSRWRVALNGAEPVTEGVVREFQDTYAPYGFRPTAMFPVYGLAESSLAVSFPDLGTPVRYMTVDRAKLADGLAVQVAAERAQRDHADVRGARHPGAQRARGQRPEQRGGRGHRRDTSSSRGTRS
jgi:acyl-CoA synthetase (AMP-forming)/AMP-acid ligase II